MVNGSFVIDAHCHIYPEKIAARAVAGTDAFYGTTARCSQGTVNELLEVGVKAGTDHFIVQSVATTPKQVRSINEFIASSVANAKGKLTGLGTMHPECEDIPGEIVHLKELGLKGIKIHPDIQARPLDHPGFLEMYACCEKEGLPVLMHTGDYRYDYSNPNRLIPVLEKFPDLTVIGAHFGGWSIWEEATEQMAKYQNLYVDCSSSLPFMKHPEIAVELIHKYGVHRVLYGTDFPMWSPVEELEHFLALNLTDDERQQILYKNAKKLFALPDSIFQTEMV